jgi:hypothetical protein
MKTNQLLKFSAVALLFVRLAGGAAAQEVTATFTNSFGDGIWQRDAHIGVIGNVNDPSTPGNWDTGAYPDYNRKIQDPNTGLYVPNPTPDYDVIIALPTTCTLGPGNYQPSIRTLNVAAVSTLDIAGGSLLAIDNGSIVNNGSILVNSDDPVNNNSDIRFDNGGTATISGTGNIQLNGAQSGRAQVSTSATTVTIASGQTIHGRGEIGSFGGSMINNGLINSDVNGDPFGLNLDLVNSAAGHKNNATIEATNGALLAFNNGVIDQTGGGTFLADGTNSLITLGIGGPSNVFFLIGGIVTTSNGGVVEGVYGNMDSVTNNGDFRIPGNDIVTITGTGLTNNGTIWINSTDPVNSIGNIRFDADGTLDGTGSVRLDGAGYNRANFNISGSTVTIGAQQTIHGRGSFVFAGGTLINNGVINADVNGDPYGINFYSGNGIVNKNNATIEATNGSVFGFVTGIIDQTGGGTFLADGANSLITLGIGGPSDVFYLIGGTVTTANGGVVLGQYGNMDSVTNNGDFRIPGGYIITITGTGLTNNGTVWINSTDPVNSISNIRWDADGTLDGNGSIKLDGSTYNRANFGISSHTVTIGANQTIHGRGTFYSNGGTLINNGVINSDVNGDPSGLNFYFSDSAAGHKNNATIEATNGGLLTFVSGVIDQTGGGTFLATGNSSKVQLGSFNGGSYGDIIGGTLNGTSGGVVSSLASILEGDITNSGAFEIPASGIVLSYASTLTNNGTITMDDNTGLFRFDQNNTAIGGNGFIALMNGAQMTINGGQSVSNGSNHTIKGNGTIGIVGGGTFTNNGFIAPGLSPGQLNLNGNLQLNFPSKLSFEIGGTTPATQYDVLNKIDGGTLILNGKLILNLINGFTPQQSDTFTILTTQTALGGNFTNVKSGGRMNTEDGGGSFQVDYHVINNAPLSQVVTLSNFGSVLPPSQGLNISTRADVGTGENVAIAGFIITGTDPKKVIIRGIGPSLSGFGLANVLADPTLELHDTSHTIATNDNWKDTQQTDIQNSGYAPGNELESAIITTLAPGTYTAILSGNNPGTGIGLVEVFDLDQAANSKLSNISTRGFVGTGDNVLIGGTIVGPSNGNSSPVLVRAVGPSLASLGVVNPLQDPTLELHDANGVLFAFNDNWKDVQQGEIEATTHAPSDDNESAIFLALAPGSWTAIVRGKNGATGVALAEVFNVQ